MEIVKITLDANLKKVSYLNPGDEVTQQLVIENNGHIYFHSQFYGGGYGQYVEGRTENLYINSNDTFDMIHTISLYFAKFGSWGVIPGMGSWKMTMTDSEGKDYMYYGSLTGAHEDLTWYIRNRIPFKGLHVFSKDKD